MQSNCKTHVWQIQPLETNKRICGVKGCRDLEDGNAVSQRCASCQQVFCLRYIFKRNDRKTYETHEQFIHCRHRHGPDHNCPVSSPADAKAHQRRLLAEAAVGRLKQQQPQPQQPKSTLAATAPVKKKVNPTIELMKMKSKAKVEMRIIEWT